MSCHKTYPTLIWLERLSVRHPRNGKKGGKRNVKFKLEGGNFTAVRAVTLPDKSYITLIWLERSSGRHHQKSRKRREIKMKFKLRGGNFTAIKTVILPARQPPERRFDKRLLRMTMTNELPTDRGRYTNGQCKGAGVPEGAQNTSKTPQKGDWGTCGGPDSFLQLIVKPRQSTYSNMMPLSSRLWVHDPFSVLHTLPVVHDCCPLQLFFPLQDPETLLCMWKMCISSGSVELHLTYWCTYRYSRNTVVSMGGSVIIHMV